MAENVLEKKDRKRGANFTCSEKQSLLSIVEKYQYIVECKRTDAMSSRQKLQAWETICQEFNARGVSPEHRPASKLKLLWDNIKRETRKKLSALRQETFKTEGGRNAVKEDLFCMQVKEIIGPTAEPMGNRFDDDSLSEDTEEVTGRFGEMCDSEEAEGTEGTEQFVVLLDENVEVSEEIETLSNHGDSDEDWSQWNPRMLRTHKSPALSVHVNGASTSALTSPPASSTAAATSSTAANTSAKTAQAKELGRLDEIVKKRFIKKPHNKGLRTRSTKTEALVQAKVDFINTLRKETAEKAALEKEILQMTLVEKQLKIDLLRKQLENGK